MLRSFVCRAAACTALAGFLLTIAGCGEAKRCVRATFESHCEDDFRVTCGEDGFVEHQDCALHLCTEGESPISPVAGTLDVHGGSCVEDATGALCRC